ncbi:MAG TPA: 3'-5' exonuclease [Candidatus Paceibacterota bacterium]|jgi:DNA polymerase III epsilon subunit-like protein|nr:3'-5' exonuclease [Candidatus Paceibacterota bacterium]
MILCSLDFETTGTEPLRDEPTEFGGVLYSTKQHRCLDSLGVLLKTEVPISSEITEKTGITKQALNRFGYVPSEILPTIVEMIESADAVIGYNCRRFDQKVLIEWAKRENVEIPNKPWIDLYYDLPYNVPVGKLSHVMADHGFLNYFPHSALSDAMGVLLIASKYDSNLLLQRSQSPTVIIRSLVDRSQNDLVKQAKFRWNPSFKIWWKAVKEQDIEEFTKSLPFKTELSNLTQEELE